MQKKLRLRFLLLSWGLLMLLLTAVCAGVGYSMYRRAEKQSEALLNKAMEEFTESVPAREYTAAGRELLMARFDEEAVLIEQCSWNMRMPVEKLKALSEKIIDSEAEKQGLIEDEAEQYRFRYARTDGGIRLVMTDYAEEQQVVHTVRHNMVWYLIIGAILLIPVSVLLSNWASKPIEEAWEKQNDFVSDATHELKTPLAVIAADTEAVLANPDASVESQEKWLGSIRGETTRMAGLVTDLLFLAKDDAHEIKLSLNMESISERMEELCMEWEVKIFEAGLMFEYEMTQNLLYRCDWTRIQQMMEELLDNAIKYTPKGGAVRLVMNRDKKQHLRIVVSNQGEAIPEHYIEKIFDRFYRIDPSRARETGGYGLGLCVANCIAKLHGGEITAESVNGLNVFTVILGDTEET